MIYINLVHFLFVLLVGYVLDHNVFVNGIIGGYKADLKYFKYQLAVGGKTNGSDITALFGGAGMVHKDYGITAAHIFIKPTGDLKDLHFQIVAGTRDLNSPNVLRIDIETIHLHNYDHSTSANDIALVKLAESIIFEGNLRLSKLELPYISQSFDKLPARIAGFGFIKVETKYNDTEAKNVRINGVTNFKLMYAFVKVFEHEQCKKRYDDVDLDKQLCGVMIADTMEDKVGTCTSDDGGPLVYNNTLVGILSRNPIDCDETEQGAVYTKVAAYLMFIQFTFNGIKTRNTRVLQNRIHVLEE